ncbi:hypothetical protein Leryth_001367 [Lithospermum erythrorhizon]|nr:hypothetical protein Leryth_001367 [Lithospermum erythrorhizon]
MATRGGGGGKKASNSAAAPPNPEMEERRRLKKLALNNNIISNTKAESSLTLNPSKTVMKHHGKDILRKSQRKNRFLFSFPGLIGPLNGGKIGELINLGSKNPILYLDFPQGQMKLFGTIVYPKNRYLTLQFSRGGKNVMCEDYFDNMIVFSDAWWIGRKEENPEELQLEFPKELNMEKHAECDFKGGAGAACKENSEKSKSRIKLTEQQPPKHESNLEDDSCDSLQYSNETMDVDRTPKRHSARTAGKTFRFAEGSSGDDFIYNDIDMSEEEDEKVDVKHPISGLDFTSIFFLLMA